MIASSVVRRSFVKIVGCLLVGFATTGCEGISNWLTGAYRGPEPGTEPLVNEVALVAGVYTPEQGRTNLRLDRLRYASRDPHHVDRVISAWATQETQSAVDGLALHRGDTVVVTTAYRGVEETSGSNGVVDWPGHDAVEYPIGSHDIVSIARAGPTSRP